MCQNLNFQRQFSITRAQESSEEEEEEKRKV
jgi:hypothetical protein